MSYKRFFAMIAASTVAMFMLMYSTVYDWSHIWWSSTKTLMALYMGATMAIIMLAFMWKMYENEKTNVGIVVGSVVVFLLAYFLFRGQTTVSDVTWMKQMIPHHSLAILTSERANISDPRVRRLADEIILAQRREIAEMEALIGDLERADYEGGDPIAPSVPPVEGGSDDVAGAPSLRLADTPMRGDILVLSEVKVASDAWIVVHPGTADGPDVSTILGRSFVMHGTTANVPVDLDASATPGSMLYVMLHDDTGEIGRFEFAGPGTPDQPLMQNGNPVVQAVSVR